MNCGRQKNKTKKNQSSLAGLIWEGEGKGKGEGERGWRWEGKGVEVGRVKGWSWGGGGDGAGEGKEVDVERWLPMVPAGMCVFVLLKTGIRLHGKICKRCKIEGMGLNPGLLICRCVAKFHKALSTELL